MWMKSFTGEILAIFLDSSFLLAYYNTADKYHKDSLAVIDKIRSDEYGHVYTSTYVLDEFFTYLQRKHHDQNYVYTLLEGWFEGSAGIAEILNVDWNIFRSAIDLMRQQKQERKPLSLTDCAIVELCKALEIDKLATYDDGFDGYISVIDATV